MTELTSGTCDFARATVSDDTVFQFVYSLMDSMHTPVERMMSATEGDEKYEAARVAAHRAVLRLYDISDFIKSYDRDDLTSARGHKLCVEDAVELLKCVDFMGACVDTAVNRCGLNHYFAGNTGEDILGLVALDGIIALAADTPNIADDIYSEIEKRFEGLGMLDIYFYWSQSKEVRAGYRRFSGFMYSVCAGGCEPSNTPAVG